MPKRSDPLVGFHFALEFDGKISVYFTECSGLGSEHEVIEYREGNEAGSQSTIKIPGRLKWANITLKRGITSDMSIWEWRKQVEDGDIKSARRNGSIVLLNESHHPVVRWTFREAWPAKITVSQPEPGSKEIAIEEVTIVYESLQRVK